MRFRGVKGVKVGLLDPFGALFCPSGSLVQHQIWFQTPHNGPTGQCLQSRYQWPIFGPLGPPLEALKGPLVEQTSHFEAQNSPKSGLLAPEMVIRWPKLTEFGPGYSMWVVTTGRTHFLPHTYVCIFWAQKCRNVLNTPKLWFAICPTSSDPFSSLVP